MEALLRMGSWLISNNIHILAIMNLKNAPEKILPRSMSTTDWVEQKMSQLITQTSRTGRKLHRARLGTSLEKRAVDIRLSSVGGECGRFDDEVQAFRPTNNSRRISTPAWTLVALEDGRKDKGRRNSMSFGTRHAFHFYSMSWRQSECVSGQ